jgi:hypothetical protein
MTETVARLHPDRRKTPPAPQDFVLAYAIMQLSPESTPAWVRGIGPALHPAADALERLLRAVPS